MAGPPQKSDKLNHTLKFIVNLLRENNIDDWFVSYGTLLGLTREGSCIDGDDDIDICINKKHWQKVYDLGSELNMLYERYVNENIIILKNTKNYTQIDFYCCEVNEQGDFIDTWEGVVWSNCYDSDKKLIQIDFEDIKINTPLNAVNKLKLRYGSTWKQRVKRGSPAGDGYHNIKII